MTRVQIVIEPKQVAPWLKGSLSPQFAYVKPDALNDMRTFAKNQVVFSTEHNLTGIVLEDVGPRNHVIWVTYDKVVKAWTKFYCEVHDGQTQVQ